ncbi:unnamed protein product [Cladocopium goreaui]|uniref:Ankyrin-3 n=1 Tax=Cladocopium goreaui TaxID=2562237 RepID=A0A9P1DKV2_9DINO|nr:unnamed protein product [Cladocopium goreaui]
MGGSASLHDGDLDFDLLCHVSDRYDDLLQKEKYKRKEKGILTMALTVELQTSEEEFERNTLESLEKQNKLTESLRDIEEKERVLHCKTSELQKSEEELEENALEVRKKKDILTQSMADLEKREQMLQEKTVELQKNEEEFERNTLESLEKQNKLTESLQDIEEKERVLHCKTSELQKSEEELGEKALEVQKKKDILTQSMADLEKREQVLQEKTVELQKNEEEFERKSLETQRVKTELDKNIHDLQEVRTKKLELLEKELLERNALDQDSVRVELRDLKAVVHGLQQEMARMAASSYSDASSVNTLESWIHVGSTKPCCFHPDAHFKVFTSDGPVLAPASMLHQGARVQSASGKVVEVVNPPEQHQVDSVIELKAGTASLVVSPDHRVLVPGFPGNKTVKAEELSEGDVVILDGIPARLSSCERKTGKTLVIRLGFKPDLPALMRPSSILSKGFRKKQLRRSLKKVSEAADDTYAGTEGPESCKYGLPFPDAWTFALRKSAIGRWGHLQVVATLQHEPSTKLELNMQKETVFPKQWNALNAFLQFATSAGGLSSASSNDELSWCFAEARGWQCMRNGLLQRCEALHGFTAAWVQGFAGDRQNRQRFVVKPWVEQIEEELKENTLDVEKKKDILTQSFADLEKREQMLQEKTVELEKNKEEFAQNTLEKQNKLTESLRDIEEKVRVLHCKTSELQKSEEELEENALEVQKKKDILMQSMADLEKRAQMLQEKTVELQKNEDEFERNTLEKQNKLTESLRDIEEKERVLHCKTSELQKSEEELGEKALEVQKKKDILTQSMADLEKREQVLQEKTVELQKNEEEFERKSLETQRVKTELDKNIHDLQEVRTKKLELLEKELLERNALDQDSVRVELRDLKAVVHGLQQEMARMAASSYSDASSVNTLESWIHVGSTKPCCFHPDAHFKVFTSDGPVLAPASMLHQGARVQSASGKVVEVVNPPEQHQVDSVIELKAGTASLVVSPDHRVLVPGFPGNKTVKAEELSEGDVVILDGIPARLSSCERKTGKTLVIRLGFKPDLPALMRPSSILSKGFRKKQLRRSLKKKVSEAADDTYAGTEGPESCKYGLPFPDAWTFALRKSAIGRWGHLQVVATLQHEPSTKLE